MPEILYKSESYEIMGSCFEVYKQKGCGFQEHVYHECLKVEFGIRKVSAVPKPKLELEYKGEKWESTLQLDFLCYGEIIVELKAVANLIDEHRAQVMNYLKAGNKKLGLLVNFGHHPQLQYERIVANDRWKTTNQLLADLHQ